MWRRAPSRLEGTLWLPRSVCLTIKAEADKHAPNETGGMLVGYEIRGEVVVVQTIPGGPGAIRKRGRFEPDGLWQQLELAPIYRDSGYHHTYLGDWHSHPAGLARPSGRDKRTAKSVARDRASRTSHPVTLIVANAWRDRSWDVAAFRFCGRKGFKMITVRRYDAENL